MFPSLPDSLIQNQPLWVGLVFAAILGAVWLFLALTGLIKSVSEMRKIEGERSMAVRNHRADELKAAIDRATRLQSDLANQDRTWKAAYSDQRDEILALHAQIAALSRDLEAAKAESSRLEAESTSLLVEIARLRDAAAQEATP